MPKGTEMTQATHRLCSKITRSRTWVRKGEAEEGTEESRHNEENRAKRPRGRHEKRHRESEKWREGREQKGWGRGEDGVRSGSLASHQALCIIAGPGGSISPRALSFHMLPKTAVKLEARRTAGYSSGCGGVDSKTRKRKRNKADQRPSYVRLKTRRLLN